MSTWCRLFSEIRFLVPIGHKFVDCELKPIKQFESFLKGFDCTNDIFLKLVTDAMLWHGSCRAVTLSKSLSVSAIRPSHLSVYVTMVSTLGTPITSGYAIGFSEQLGIDGPRRKLLAASLELLMRSSLEGEEAAGISGRYTR